MTLINCVNEASFFFKGYVFEITGNKVKIGGKDFLYLLNFFKGRYTNFDVPSFIHYSFNLSYEGKIKKRQELRFTIDDIFCEISINSFISMVDFKNFLSKFDFSFLNNYEFDKKIMFEEDEMNRLIYHNKENGLAWCISNTSGYSNESKTCKSCIFKVKCLIYKVKK